MRVALLSPYFREQARGNAVTVNRIRCHLERAGLAAAVFSLDQEDAAALPGRLRQYRPDLVHAFHLTRCGGLAAAVARDAGIPYLLTLTGTDVYRSAGPTYQPAELAVIAGAAGITAFSAAVAAGFAAAAGYPVDRIAVVRQGVELPDRPLPLPDENTDFIFLLPAGIRRVKNVRFPLPLLADLHRSYPRIRFRLVGPVLEDDYAAGVLAAMAAEPSAEWGGELAPAAMAAEYAAAAVVLNCSHSEGGMANSLLEAMAWGRPVLASRVAGNASLVTDGDNGLLYDGPAEFIARAELLYRDQELRERLVAGGRGYVSRNCSPAAEAAGYVALYEKLLAGAGRQ